jgi:hypothetical protein
MGGGGTRGRAHGPTAWQDAATACAGAPRKSGSAWWTGAGRTAVEVWSAGGQHRHLRAVPHDQPTVRVGGCRVHLLGEHTSSCPTCWAVVRSHTRTVSSLLPVTATGRPSTAIVANAFTALRPADNYDVLATGAGCRRPLGVGCRISTRGSDPFGPTSEGARAGASPPPARLRF